MLPYAVVLGGADRWLDAIVAADTDVDPDSERPDLVPRSRELAPARPARLATQLPHHRLRDLVHPLIRRYPLSRPHDLTPLAVRRSARSALPRRGRTAGAADRVPARVRAPARSTGRRPTSILSAMRHRAAELGRARAAICARPELPRRAWPRSTSRLEVIQPTTWSALHFVDRLAERALDRAAAGPRLRHLAGRLRRLGRRPGRQRLLMEDFYRDARRRLDVLMDGGEPGQRALELRRREPRARRRRARDRLGVAEPWWPTEDEIDDAGPGRPGPLAGRRGPVRRRRRPPPLRRHPRRGAGRAGALRPPPAADASGRYEDAALSERPLDGALAALGAAQPGTAGSARGGAGRRGRVSRRGTRRSPPSRVSSAR